VPGNAQSAIGIRQSDVSHPSASRAALTLAALGIVFGDIGTSPLYALRECFYGPHAVAPTPGNVMGVLSLIFWALVLVISIKYVSYVMRADNQGEGGILALMALIPPTYRDPQSRGVLLGLGLFGSALLYGDGIITPAISVLGAVEGLSTATPALTPYVVPVSAAVLAGLFLVQYRGTAKVGAMFGPVMVVWFVTIGGLGLHWLVQSPSVLGAMNPSHAVEFFATNRYHGFVVLGSVFLVVTGGEALYADMGHFGPGPIRLAWFGIVMPGLLLNYFGQGAMLLINPSATESPFYRLAPSTLVLPLVILATAAAVIASQALISAVFSLTRQAVQLGYSPRVEIRHTSATTIGQIYVPTINWALAIATIALVVAFRSSSALAAAYGIAVTLTMAITTILAYVIARQVWRWNRWTAGAVTAVFLTVDLAFFGANALKILHGGWVPLVLAAGVFMLLSTWKTGRSILGARLRERAYPFELFQKDLQRARPHRVAGTAIFMTGSGAGVPPTLIHNLRHNKVLHASVVLLTVVTEDVPHVADGERVDHESLGSGFFRVTLRYGFMEEPSVPEAMSEARAKGLPIDKDDITYFLGRETLLSASRPGMAQWREKLFALMSRNAMRATAFFRIPPERVVELGMQVEL
jgi:KUP system potassium uptake protein